MIVDTSITGSISYIRKECERQQALFYAQPVIIQRFLEAQSQKLATAMIEGRGPVRFTLPDQVIDKVPYSGDQASMRVPHDLRDHIIGGWRTQFDRNSFRETLRQELVSLEQSPDQAVSTSASLLRYSTAIFLVHTFLPSGRNVTYHPGQDELIPTIPDQDISEKESALTAVSDAVAEESRDVPERGELQVPFVPAARRFFLPQWVAFDDDGRLLVGSVADAEAYQLSMENYVAVLHAASSLAPYIVADQEYQRKRYGILGQVINQGRALAHYKTMQIIRTIQERVANGTLNRGLRINLPYYDDQDLHMAEIEMEIIPSGRIAFKAVFILRAVRLEAAKIEQDTRLNQSTRKYLLQELDMLEKVFIKISQK